MGLRNKKHFNDCNIFFITTTCFSKMNLLEIGNSISIIQNSLQFTMNKYDSKMLGYVIMPNHIHLVMFFQNGKDRIGFMRDFKKYTSTKIRIEIEQESPNTLEDIIYMKREQIFKIWTDRYDEVYLDSRKNLESVLDYIHNNPLQVNWNLAKEPIDYPFRSATFYSTGKQNNLYITHYLEMT